MANLLFEPPLRILAATYAVHLRFIEKLVVNFILVIIELFSLGVTAEALRANINWNSAFFERVGQFGPKFQVDRRRGRPPLTIIRVQKLYALTFHMV